MNFGPRTSTSAHGCPGAALNDSMPCASMRIANSLLATAMGSRGVAMFLQWVARRPDPSRKRCHAGVLLGAHIHTVALTTVSTLR